MITGAHVIIYSRDADADRAFGRGPGLIRDVLGYPHVDAGGGWLIFKVPPAEVAVHPTDGPETHEWGVEFAEPVRDEGWGPLTASG
jgi:hypothetical protein